MIRPGIYRLCPKKVPLHEFARFVHPHHLHYVRVARALGLWWPRVFMTHPAALTEVDSASHPTGVLDCFRGPRGQLQADNFEVACSYRLQMVNVDLFATALLSANRATSATLIMGFGPAEVRQFAITLTSHTTSSQIIATTSRSPFLAEPPEVVTQFLPGADLSELRRVHTCRVAELSLDRFSPAGVLRHVASRGERFLEYQLQRGAVKWVAHDEMTLRRSILRA